jgi:hypothetical protein
VPFAITCNGPTGIVGIDDENLGGWIAAETFFS